MPPRKPTAPDAPYRIGDASTPREFNISAFALVAKRGVLTGTELRWLREQAQITDRQMAVAVACTTRHVADVEAGTSNLSYAAEVLWRLMVVSAFSDRLTHYLMFAKPAADGRPGRRRKRK